MGQWLVGKETGDGYQYGVVAEHGDGGRFELHGFFPDYAAALTEKTKLETEFDDYGPIKVVKIELPEVDSPDPPVDDERGPNSNYQMFSREGNDACEALVQKIVAEGEAGKINRLTLHAAVRAGIKEISKKYLEVQDTEPDGEIPYQINERLCKPMRWVEYGRWTD